MPLPKPHPLRDQFLNALAEFLTRDLGNRSIQLQMGNAAAIEWSKLFQLSGCRGYPTKDEAIAAMTHVLYSQHIEPRATGVMKLVKAKPKTKKKR